MSSRTFLMAWLALMPCLVLAQASIDSFTRLPANLKYFGLGISKPWGVATHLGRCHESGLGGSLNFIARTTSEGHPTNYDGGNNLFGSGSDVIPKDLHAYGSLHALYLRQLRRSNTYFGIELGPSLILSRVSTNFVPNPKPCETDPFFGITFCAPNYTYQKISRTDIGFSGRARLGTLFGDTFSFELGGVFITGKYPFYGIYLAGNFFWK